MTPELIFQLRRIGVGLARIAILVLACLVVAGCYYDL